MSEKRVRQSQFYTHIKVFGSIILMSTTMTGLNYDWSEQLLSQTISSHFPFSSSSVWWDFPSLSWCLFAILLSLLHLGSGHIDPSDPSDTEVSHPIITHSSPYPSHCTPWVREISIFDVFLATHRFMFLWVVPHSLFLFRHSTIQLISIWSPLWMKRSSSAGFSLFTSLFSQSIYSLLPPLHTHLSFSTFLVNHGSFDSQADRR